MRWGRRRDNGQRGGWEGEEAPGGLTEVTPVSVNTDSGGDGRPRRFSSQVGQITQKSIWTPAPRDQTRPPRRDADAAPSRREKGGVWSRYVCETVPGNQRGRCRRSGGGGGGRGGARDEIFEFDEIEEPNGLTTLTHR